MDNNERKIRINVAIEMLERTYRDICSDSNVDRKTKEDMCDIIISLINFHSRLGKDEVRE